MLSGSEYPIKFGWSLRSFCAIPHPPTEGAPFTKGSLVYILVMETMPLICAKCAMTERK